LPSITKTFFDGNLATLRVVIAELAKKGVFMKRIYEKPTLSKRQKLSNVVAGGSIVIKP
jgi:hypothetical protein